MQTRGVPIVQPKGHDAGGDHRVDDESATPSECGRGGSRRASEAGSGCGAVWDATRQVNCFETAYQRDGADGLVSRKEGRPSNRLLMEQVR